MEVEMESDADDEAEEDDSETEPDIEIFSDSTDIEENDSGRSADSSQDSDSEPSARAVSVQSRPNAPTPASGIAGRMVTRSLSSSSHNHSLLQEAFAESIQEGPAHRDHDPLNEDVAVVDQGGSGSSHVPVGADSTAPSQSMRPIIHTVNAADSERQISGQDNQQNDLLNVSNHSDDDGQTCPICFESWTNTTEHRLVALKCGHLFGLSCIEKWLKGQGGRCPQCNRPSKKSDIRIIYAKCLKVLDTSERDRALRELEKEKGLRQIAELEVAQAQLRYQMALQECEKLKRELSEQKALVKQLRAAECSGQNRESRDTPPQQRHYVLEKSLDVSKDGGCRVMATSDILTMLLVTQPSPNNLFPGFGIKKVSPLDFRGAEFLFLHQKAIKDIAFHTHDSIVLTASLDRTVKLTNVRSNSVVQTYQLAADVWSCSWSKDDPCYFYAGLKNGSVFQFDTRVTSGHVCQLPSVGLNSPVVSLQYAYNSRHLSSSVRTSGPLIGQLSMCYFCETKANQDFKIYPLPFEGKFTSLSFEPVTGHVLVSCRPSAKHNRVTHMLCELSMNNNCQCNVVQMFEGGSTQVQLSKSKVFLHPANQSSMLICAGDESAQSALLWESGSGRCIQQLKAESPILDVNPMKINQSSFLTTLTEKTLRFYKWTEG